MVKPQLYLVNRPPLRGKQEGIPGAERLFFQKGFRVLFFFGNKNE